MNLFARRDRHALLVKSNGINKLVVVINKMDDRE